jgi:hypothetical protein
MKQHPFHTHRRDDEERPRPLDLLPECVVRDSAGQGAADRAR